MLLPSISLSNPLVQGQFPQNDHSSCWLGDSWGVSDSKQWVERCADSHQFIIMQLEVKNIKQIMGQKPLLLVYCHITFGLCGKLFSQFLCHFPEYLHKSQLFLEEIKKKGCRAYLNQVNVLSAELVLRQVLPVHYPRMS